MYDLIIVGCGPAGLAASLSAKRHGLDYLAIERGVIAETVYNYPVARSLFSTSEEVELQERGLGRRTKPTREQVLSHYTDLVIRERLRVKPGEEVLEVEDGGQSFLVSTNLADYRARTVLLTVGGFGRQRLLGVGGEDSTRVSYRFREAHPYALRSVLVVGGGNSAAEAALFLSEVGAKVTLCVRRRSLDGTGEIDSGQSIGTGAKIKPWVLEPLERAAREGKVSILTSAEVIEILPDSAVISAEHNGEGRIVEVACEHIFALIGADPDTHLLEAAGAEIASDGRPVYSTETYETTVSGLYVAGHLTRELHIKNAIEVGGRVVVGIASRLHQKSFVSSM
jgi:thioredoxin reductase (NADPH)